MQKKKKEQKEEAICAIDHNARKARALSIPKAY
jgi:hypothetical protein